MSSSGDAERRLWNAHTTFSGLTGRLWAAGGSDNDPYRRLRERHRASHNVRRKQFSGELVRVAEVTGPKTDC